jgi:hypothetical protein
MGGGMAQLASYGQADVVLTGNPQITYWKLVYRRHTNFSVEAIESAFQGPVDFGKRATVQVPRNGDLVSRMWLQITLPDVLAYDIAPAPTEGQTIDVTGVLYQNTTDYSWWKDSAKTDYQVAWYSAGKYYTFTTDNEIPTWPYMLADRSPAKDDVATVYTRPTQRVRWCNSVGHAIVSSCEIEIGGSRIDKHFSEWWDVWSELSEKEERRTGLWEMIGKYSSATYDVAATASSGTAWTRDMSRQRTYFVPLTFCYNRSPGLSIPMVALQYHQININFEFRPYMELIRSYNLVSAVDTALTSLSSKSGALAPTFVDCKLYTDFVFLDTEERRRFASIPHEYLVEQLQFLGDEAVNSTALNRKIILSFNHPVKELIMVYVPATAYAVNTKDGNSIFTYDVADPGAEPFETVKLLLNGHDRFSERPGAYFRLVQPYQHHTRVPTKKVYAYSFALSPEEFQPSGTCNFSRLDTAQLAVTMNAGCTLGRVKVYALGYNVLRIASGLSGLAFAN